MARIFVSYNRKNIEFCKRLTDELLKRDLDLWVDWEDIPPTVDWLKEIEKGVEEADTFLAIITNEWIGSRNCTIELEYAVKNGKRLIPVVPYDIVWGDVPPDLALLNFIFFTEKFDFNAQLDKLFTALDTDYDWLKTHRRLQVKALDWERGNKENGYLLRGKDLEEAEQQIFINANKDPYFTDLQHEYVLLSRQATDRQRKITTISLYAAIVVMLGIIVALAYPYVAEWVARGWARGELVLIQGGDFYMGATDPVVVATGERGEWLANIPTFSIEKYEVTNRQYALCVDYGNCTPPGNLAYYQDPQKTEFPVMEVNVYQASTYCQWLGRRLPSELEWMRAARGLNDRRLWPWGDSLPTTILTNLPFEGSTETSEIQPVTAYPGNLSPDSVQNMVGNALEWTSSYYQSDYYYGDKDYDPSKYWNGQVNTYDGNQAFIRLGGSWQRPIVYLAEINPLAGYNTEEDTGMRCASD